MPNCGSISCWPTARRWPTWRMTRRLRTATMTLTMARPRPDPAATDGLRLQQRPPLPSIAAIEVQPDAATALPVFAIARRHAGLVDETPQPRLRLVRFDALLLLLGKTREHIQTRALFDSVDGHEVLIKTFIAAHILRHDERHGLPLVVIAARQPDAEKRHRQQGVGVIIDRPHQDPQDVQSRRQVIGFDFLQALP